MLPNFFLKLATKCLSNKLKKDNSQNGLEEQISACKEMAESIKTLIQSKDKFSDNKLAVLGETLNRIVRHATDLYIKKIEAPWEAQYYEDGLENASGKVFEHVIPLNSHLVPMYMKDLISFNFLIRLPSCKISKNSDKKIKGRLKDYNSNIEYPFQRYMTAGIDSKIFKMNGEPIDCMEYSLKDHLKYFITDQKIIDEQMLLWSKINENNF